MVTRLKGIERRIEKLIFSIDNIDHASKEIGNSPVKAYQKVFIIIIMEGSRYDFEC